jgi:hypothetical protein
MPTPKPSEPYQPAVDMGPRPWRQDKAYPVQSMLTQYPYGAAMGFGCAPLHLFRGEEYSPVGIVLPGYGCDSRFGFGGLFDDIGHFVSNTVKVAGREIGHVSHAIQDAAGKISHEITKIPIIGGALHVVFDAVYHSTMGLINMTVAIVVEGKRIDQAVMGQLHTLLHDLQQVAPYAQMVISVIPGIGPGVSAALSAGLALAEGQSISDALKAGLIGALPGGPLVKAAVTMGVETIQHVAKGDKVDLATLSQTAGGIAASALGLPIVAKNALMSGISVVGGLVRGQPLDKTVTDGAIAALPVTPTIKNAMTQATALTLDLAHGAKVDRALMSRMEGVASMLPVDSALRDGIKTGLNATKNVAQGKNVEQVCMAAIQSGVGEQLVSMGAGALPSDVQKAIKSGVALGGGVVTQARRADQLIKSIPGKLVESGVQLAKTAPMFGEARKIAKDSTRGFDMASGLIQQQAKFFDVVTVRNALDPIQKKGFDLACCARIGAVAHPKPLNLSPAAHAGHAITMGMQSYVPDRKQAMMQAVQAVPSAAVGATVAIKEVAAVREGWLSRLLKALGLKK